MDKDESNIFDQITKDIGPLPPWRPGWYYNNIGNCIHAYWYQTKEGEYNEYINNSITLIKDCKYHEIIGIQIKNITQGLDNKDPNDFPRMD